MHTTTHTPAHPQHQASPRTKTHTRMSHFITSLHVLLAATTLSVATKAQAQQLYTSAGLIAYATVIQPLSITVTHNLEFGTLIVGATKTVEPTTTAAGQFQIHGQSDATVAVTFTMPTALTLVGDDGIELPVSDWTYATSYTSSTVSGNGGPGSPITFGSPMNFTLPTNATGPALMSLGVGATVTASASQATGDYIGQGNVTIAYTDY